MLAGAIKRLLCEALRLSKQSRHRTHVLLLAGNGMEAGGASRDRTGDLLVANQTLSQLSYGPASMLVGLGGVAPPTSPLSGVRSN
jgi:hypothetical protein